MENDRSKTPFGQQLDGKDDFLDERLQSFGPVPGQGGLPPHVPPHPLYADPFASMPKKSKLVAGVLSFLIPGTGHFYLGLMQKGLFIMLLFILNIAAIPYTVNNYSSLNNSYIPFVVLLACLIPVIYFYNLFDALQSTDQINAYRRAVQLGQIPPAPSGSDPLGRQGKGNYLGIFLIAIGFFLFVFSSKPAWMADMFNMMGSYIGAVILIGAGFILFVSETRKK